MEKEIKRNSFKGSIGFVLAAAGSAVGLGNIWRFPYLAAKDGGGMFLVIYLILALTFGFTLLITEIAIGRKTKQSPLTAYGKISEKWKGLAVYVIPNFEGMTVKRFFSILLDAMGQLFFSLSIAMGIMIAYGSYVNDNADIRKSINQIEIFDTAVAFLAGVMIIPAVFTFAGTEGMEASGPSLMFVTLPKVFSAMGRMGNIIGCLFFAMVLFAAVTSSVSVMEAVVSSFMDRFSITRRKAASIETIIALAAGIVVCMGYNVLYFECKLPNGSIAQILDIMDYISNNFLMPLVAVGTCILVGWIAKPKTVIDEVEKSGVKMGRKKLYIVMVKYIAPLMLIVLFLKSVGILTVI